jgi:hypothetical protein
LCPGGKYIGFGGPQSNSNDNDLVKADAQADNISPTSNTPSKYEDTSQTVDPEELAGYNVSSNNLLNPPMHKSKEHYLTLEDNTWVYIPTVINGFLDSD